MTVDRLETCVISSANERRSAGRVGAGMMTKSNFVIFITFRAASNELATYGIYPNNLSAAFFRRFDSGLPTTIRADFIEIPAARGYTFYVPTMSGQNGYVCCVDVGSDLLIPFVIEIACKKNSVFKVIFGIFVGGIRCAGKVISQGALQRAESAFTPSRFAIATRR